jgi:hypothetical protein
MWLSLDVGSLAGGGGGADVEYDPILEECLAAIRPANRAPRMAAAATTVPDSGGDLQMTEVLPARHSQLIWDSP